MSARRRERLSLLIVNAGRGGGDREEREKGRKRECSPPRPYARVAYTRPRAHRECREREGSHLGVVGDSVLFVHHTTPVSIISLPRCECGGPGKRCKYVDETCVPRRERGGGKRERVSFLLSFFLLSLACSVGSSFPPSLAQSVGHSTPQRRDRRVL